MNHKKTPPLIAWFFAIALALVTIAVVYQIVGEPVLKYLNADRLNVADTSKTVKRVIIIGTSLIRRAVYFDEVMDSLAASNQMSEYRFNRFVLGGGHLSFFFPLFEKIIEAEPDIIIFQNSLILYDKANRYPIFDNRKKYYKEWLGYSLGIDEHNKNYFFNRMPNKKLTNERIRQSQIRTQTPDNVKKSVINKKKFYIRDIAALPPELDNFLISAEAKRIRMLSVNILVSPDIRLALPASEELRIILQEQYQKKYGITFWEFPFDLGMDSYLDLNHVTPAVQHHYSEWLINKIKNMDE